MNTASTHGLQSPAACHNVTFSLEDQVLRKPVSELCRQNSAMLQDAWCAISVVFKHG